MADYDTYDPAAPITGTETILVKQGGVTKKSTPDAYKNFIKYTLPVASVGFLGGIKSGTDITVDGVGNVSVNSGGHNHDWSNITSGLPTTLLGYGITDAAPLSHQHTWITINSTPSTLLGYGITDAAPISHLGGDIHIDWSVTGIEDVHPDRYSGVADHELLINIGTNSHVQIDTHLGLTNQHLDWTTDQGAKDIHTGNYTNTTYVDSDWDHDLLTGFLANEHIDWSVTGAEDIHPDRYATSGYILPVATDIALGGIRLFSDADNPTVANTPTSTIGRTYGIQLNAANQAVVNVPWTTSVYNHPSHTSRTESGDTGPLTGATVISDLDFNMASDTLGHVTAFDITTLATREMTYGDLGITANGIIDWTAGTVAGFHSLGIDDNTTTGERLQITDTYLELGDGVPNSDYGIFKFHDTGSLKIGGGWAPDWAGIRLFGFAHASQAMDFVVRANNVDVTHYDHSLSLWDFKTNDILTSGDVTGANITTHLGLVGEHINWTNTSNALDTTGNVTGNNFIVGFSTGGMWQTSNIGYLTIGGGDGPFSGASIWLYSPGFTGRAADVWVRSGLTTTLYYDYSATNWDFQANDIITTGDVTGANITTHFGLTNEHIDWSVTGAEVVHADRYTSGGGGYTLPVADTGILGGILDGTDIAIDASGNVSVVDDSHNHTYNTLSGFSLDFQESITTQPTAGFGRLWYSSILSTPIFSNSVGAYEIVLKGKAYHNTFSDYLPNEHIDWTNGTEVGFNSLGIQDNALGLRAVLSDSAIKFGNVVGTDPFHIGRVINAGVGLTIGPDTLATTGAVIHLNSTQDSGLNNSDMFITADDGMELHYDHSASLWNFQANDIETTGDVTGGLISADNIVSSNLYLTIQDSFYMGALNTTTPELVFDGVASLQYNRTLNTWGFNYAFTDIFTINPTYTTVETGAFRLKEQVGAQANVAGYGQIYCKTAVPTELWFVNDIGVGVQLGVDWKAGTVSGFNSLGIDDNATIGERLQVSDTYSQFGDAVAASDYNLLRPHDTGSFKIGGGWAADWAGIRTFAFGHLTQSCDFQIMAEQVAEFHYDHSASLMDFAANDIYTLGSLAVGTAVAPTANIDMVNEAGSALNMFRYQTTSNGVAINFKKASGTEASPIALAINHKLMGIQAQGWGTDFSNIQGSIYCSAEAAFTGTSKPTYMTFRTTAVDAVSDTEHLRITSDGAVKIGAPTGTTSTGSINVSDGYYVNGVAISKTDKHITIETPASGDNISWFFTDAAITVNKLVGVMDAGTSVVLTIKHGTSRATGTTVDILTVASTTTGTIISTGFDDATIPANSFVWIEGGTVTGAVTQVHVTLLADID